MKSAGLSQLFLAAVLALCLAAAGPAVAAVTGTCTASGQSAAYTPNSAGNKNPYFNLSIYGSGWVGTIQVQRYRLTVGAWENLTLLGSTGYSFTAPASEILYEPEGGVSYRLDCTWVSGTIPYSLGNQ